MTHGKKKKGSNPIHIKPSHKGRLTKKIGKPTVKKLEKAKHSSSAATRKQATFAMNARSWNKGGKKKKHTMKRGAVSHSSGFSR